jgi:hypothetical protein
MQAIGGFYIGGTPALTTGSSTGFCYLIRKSWPQPLAKGDRKTGENQTQPNQKSHRLESSPSSISNADRPGDEPELPTTRSVFRLALPLDFTRKSQPGESPPP